MVQALFRSAVFFCLLSAVPAAIWAQDDPPSRVLRLNYISGSVAMEPAGIDEWAPALVNRPFSTDDYLYADARSVAELHTDTAAIRLGEYTNVGVLNLTDSMLQLKLTQGDLYFRVRYLQPNEVLEVDTPNAAINLLRDGVYRIHVDPNAQTTFVVARNGRVEITGGGQAFTLNRGDAVSLSGTDSLAYSVQSAPAPDVFDNWCAERDARFDSAQATQYIPPTVIGYEDLEDHGVWNETPDYGAVWIPSGVPVGWAPYHYGHWAWIEPWGWTWVDDAPWGFAPFHYGRWVYWHERWGWAPGPLRIAVHGPYSAPVLGPVYAPAMVAWFGGAHWGVTIGIGSAPSVGWVPLGWGEVYTPAYHVTPRYFNNVNVYNTRIVNNVNITNVYRTVYVNKTVYNQTFVNVHAPNAVVAMRQEQFATGHPVREAGIDVHRDQLVHFAPVQAAVVAPPVAPSRQAVLTTLGRPAPHPQVAVVTRAVVVRSAPPAPIAPFAERRAFLEQHAGQPHNFMQMHEAVARTAPTPREVAVVHPSGPHQTSAPQPIVLRPGEQSNARPEVRGSAVPSINRANPQNTVQPVNRQQAPNPLPAHHGTPPSAATPNGVPAPAQEHRMEPEPQRSHGEDLRPRENRVEAPPAPRVVEPEHRSQVNEHATTPQAPHEHTSRPEAPHVNPPHEQPHNEPSHGNPPAHNEQHAESGNQGEHKSPK